VRWLLTASIILSVLSTTPSQGTREDNMSRADIASLTYTEMASRIFETERGTITLLAHSHLLTEVYIQSLGYSHLKGINEVLSSSQEYVLDDKYFLAAVDLAHLYEGPPVEKQLFARSKVSKYIETNANGREKLTPLGQFAMFFVDLTSFDANTYTLTYKGRERVGDTDSMLFSVAPNNPRDSGRFSGQIWVQPSSASIIRIRGVFTGPFGRAFHHLYYAERHFHFDSWREQVGDGLWLPTIAYFDESGTFPIDGDLAFHYRGYTLLWQHQQHANTPGDSAQYVTSPDLALAAARSQHQFRNDALARLDTDGLLAIPGPVEQSLNAITQRIAKTSGVPLDGVECRVLLTTPAEIFSVGNVIIVSRGLLNLIPDDSVFAVLVARQIAHIILSQSDAPRQLFQKSIFELGGRKDFPGLRIQRTRKQDAAADEKAILLLNGSPYRDAIAPAKIFLSLLKTESHRFPNLLRARFGSAMVPAGSTFAQPTPTTRSVASNDVLFFRNRYGVSWNGAVVGPDKTLQPDQGRHPTDEGTKSEARKSIVIGGRGIRATQ